MKETASLITEYLQKKPSAVFKMAYRLMDKGSAQCKTSAISMCELLKLGNFIEASKTEKIKAVRSILQNCEENPSNQFVLAIESISLTSISKEEAFRLLKQVYEKKVKIEENVQVLPAIIRPPVKV